MVYRHDEDAETLRGVLVTLTTQAGIKQKALLSELDGAPDSKTKEGMSLATFRRFIKGIGRSEKLDVVEWIWDFLHAHPKHHVYFAKQKVSARPTSNRGGKARRPSRSPEYAVSEALQRFVFAEKPVSKEFMTSLHERYPGRYVMYRADLRPLKRNTGAPPRFRASCVEITLNKKHLFIKETQDFPKSKWEDAFYMQTSGVMFPYGKHILFVARAIIRESFRFGVIDREFSFTNDYKVTSFQGTLLVASSEDMFPSTAFFCLRDDGALKTGLLTLEEIDNVEARAHLADAHKKAAFHYELSHSVMKP